MGIKIKVSTEPIDQFKELLINTIWGIEGKTRYSHQDTLQNLGKLVNSTFLYLMKSERLLGGINLNQRDFEVDEQRINGMYIRYFTFMHSYQSRDIGPRKGKRSGLIKSQLEELFEHGKLGEDESEKFFYAYIELENERSARICREFGFTPLRKLSTTIFTRFFPGKNPNVRIVKGNERENIRSALREFYSDYSMYHDQQLFNRGEYFIFEENGIPVAGLQANPTHWRIVELPGISGTIIMKFIPHLPIIKRVFNPKNHRFLSFDQLFFLKGHEDKIEPLMESALAMMEIHNGMIWTDTDCKVNRAINSCVNPGIMNKLKNDVPGNIIGRVSGKDKGMLSLLSEKPAYICSFDLT